MTASSTKASGKGKAPIHIRICHWSSPSQPPSSPTTMLAPGYIAELRAISLPRTPAGNSATTSPVATT
jgi:hypothetical protein